MSSLFGMIGNYQGELTMLPIMTVIFVLATILCYILFNRYSLIKYIPALIGIILGVFFTYQGVNSLIEPEGLETTWRGVYFFVAGCIALGSAWIMAILSSMHASDRVREQVQKRLANRQKRTNSKPVHESRVSDTTKIHRK